ncbi:hypothetical protein OHA72_41140 [Dactylosporangium sp. NBC_01737]|uniref:hypothetical protein n=1 Tax=Dactylosporangium sp. NBC_01737 TaxID=2975959 RepID=UPI002E12A5F1|nr:hypothetical protein OHA72_41140 [Dactylosporangium sp. NBC_01737]
MSAESVGGHVWQRRIVHEFPFVGGVDGGTNGNCQQAALEVSRERSRIASTTTQAPCPPSRVASDRSSPAMNTVLIRAGAPLRIA